MPACLPAEIAPNNRSRETLHAIYCSLVVYNKSANQSVPSPRYYVGEHFCKTSLFLHYIAALGSEGDGDDVQMDL